MKLQFEFSDIAKVFSYYLIFFTSCCAMDYVHSSFDNSNYPYGIFSMYTFHHKSFYLTCYSANPTSLGCLSIFCLVRKVLSSSQIEILIGSSTARMNDDPLDAVRMDADRMNTDLMRTDADYKNTDHMTVTV